MGQSRRNAHHEAPIAQAPLPSGAAKERSCPSAMEVRCRNKGSRSKERCSRCAVRAASNLDLQSEPHETSNSKVIPALVHAWCQRRSASARVQQVCSKNEQACGTRSAGRRTWPARMSSAAISKACKWTVSESRSSSHSNQPKLHDFGANGFEVDWHSKSYGGTKGIYGRVHEQTLLSRFSRAWIEHRTK